MIQFDIFTFSLTSLLVANTLQLVSCKKKGQKVSNGTDEEKTAQQVELEIATKLKTEIRNVIDEIVTNPTGNDWIINLVENFNDQYQAILNSFNVEIEKAMKEGKHKKIEFSKIANLDETLIETVKLKFASLKEMIIKRIEKKEAQLGITNFDFELDLESVLPMLTTLTGKQVLDAINKLKEFKGSSNITYLAISDASTIDDIKKLDLFKVITDLQYTFSFGSKQYNDSYNNCELF